MIAVVTMGTDVDGCPYTKGVKVFRSLSRATTYFHDMVAQECMEFEGINVSEEELPADGPMIRGYSILPDDRDDGQAVTIEIMKCG
jgi:hypothetical protein